MSTVIAKPQVEIDEAIKKLVKRQTERCVIVHCRFFSKELSAIRIWPSTFLIQDTGKKSKLIEPFNIALMPHWTQHFVVNDFVRFTLVFEGLSKLCKSFYLLEDIPESYAFYSGKILRNRTDVYYTEVFVD
ncbi:hypothetical protein EFY79_07250 [Hanamia caeni]|jgi:hypothetical protein|uniref:Uncharacterized protein n=1 Tax=Hanamia caeni TaxID=2294116 RepID=A0A3M9NJQ0_9BACT|nr:hypothetical protein [Hanamia caeni]RNI38020.1 hypothetical protein EFY79_07250 [Hanamia caeni]